MTTEARANALDDHLHLRAASIRDAWPLARLRRAALVELGILAAPDAMRFEVDAYREICDLFESGLLAAWVLVTSARIAGAACVVSFRRLPYPTTSWHAELAGVYVEESLRRRGFARELCAEALGAARASGARKIFVTPSNAGRALYQELGFTPTGSLALAFE